MNIKPITYAVFLAILISCKKETIQTVGNEKLSKIEIYDPSTQNTITAEFTYNNVGNLIQIYSSGGNLSNQKQALAYDALGKIVSNTVSDNVNGDEFKFDFEIDGNGRIIKATGTSFSPNHTIDNHTYTYNNEGELIADSVFTQSGSLNSFVLFEYDNNNNVTAYQQYVNEGSSLLTQGKMTFQYDNKRSPYYNIGQLLYTSLGGSGVSYFYLSKNNPVNASLNNTVITPGGNFLYEYYGNSLLKTSTLNVQDAIKFTFFYTD